MRLVVDQESGLVSKLLFRLGTVYDAKLQRDGQIILVEIGSTEPPTVKPRRLNGRLRGAIVTLDRRSIAKALRTERDSR